MKVKNMQELHEAVGKREGYRCQRCKKLFSAECYFIYKKGKRINAYVCAHHDKHSRGARPDLAFETDGCKNLCYRCHEAIHRGK